MVDRHHVPEFMRGLTVRMVAASASLRQRVNEVLSQQGYELVMPPDVSRVGDEYLDDGKMWFELTAEIIESIDPSNDTYIVRRMTEHHRMFKFFFGN